MKVIAVVTLMLGASILLLTRNVADARPTNNDGSNIGASTTLPSVSVGAPIDTTSINKLLTGLNSKILETVNNMGTECCCGCGKSSTKGGSGSLDFITNLLKTLLSGKGTSVDVKNLFSSLGVLNLSDIDVIAYLNLFNNPSSGYYSGCPQGTECGASQQSGKLANVETNKIVNI